MSLLERRVLWTMRHVEKPVNDRDHLLAVMTIAPSALDYALKRLVEQGYVKKFADGDDRAEFYALTVDGLGRREGPAAMIEGQSVRLSALIETQRSTNTLLADIARNLDAVTKQLKQPAPDYHREPAPGFRVIKPNGKIIEVPSELDGLRKVIADLTLEKHRLVMTNAKLERDHDDYVTKFAKLQRRFGNLERQKRKSSTIEDRLARLEKTLDRFDLIAHTQARLKRLRATLKSIERAAKAVPDKVVAV